jgi:hypothetical protein
MSWQRRGERRYFYHSKREGKRIRNRYFGRGPAAELLAEQASATRRAREEVAKLAGELEPPDGLLAALEDGADRLLEATLLSLGYYRQCRRWRGPRRVRRIANPCR